MEIKEFSSWVTIVISITAGLLISNIWYIFFKKPTSKNKNIDYGLLFLSLALFVWGISGIVTRLIPNDLSYFEIIKSAFSSCNNVFLLMGASYLESSPKWIKNNKTGFVNFMTTFTIVVTFMIFSTVLVSNYTSKIEYLKLPDFVLSVLTVLVLGYSLFTTFLKRRLLTVAFFSSVTLIFILVAQPTVHFFVLNYKSDQYILLGLCTRMSFIIIICLLAYSWAQEKFSNAQQEVTSLVDEVVNLKQEVKLKEETASKDERETAWQDIAMKAAHKIGNPLESADKFNKLLLKKLNAQDLKESRAMQNQIHESLNDAKYVLSEFKSLTKLLEIKPQFCDLMKIISQVCKSDGHENASIEINLVNKKAILDHIKQHSNEIRLRADETVDLYIDRDKIKQCFTELVTNSVHFFNKELKIIKITVEYVETNIPEELNQEKEYVKIVYCDNGIGVEENRKKKIFNPFDTTYQHGSGLGLAIVNRTIELHQGMIFENGKYTEGARFELYLPVNLTQKT